MSTDISHDAADELVLLHEFKADKILVIDDVNGYLTCNLPGRITSYSSNILGKKDIEENLVKYKIDATVITDIDNFPESVDLIVLRLPKFIDLLEYYIQIIGHKYPGVKVVVAGMAKYMPISMVRLMEGYFNNVKTSLTKKKARLIFGEAAFNSSNPKSFPVEYEIDDVVIKSYPGVFSSERIDIGTRFLKNNIPFDFSGTILDLGCGSGVLGLCSKKQNPNSRVVLTDSSYMAIKSAKESFAINNLEGEFYTMDCLSDYPEKSVDLILCNPPFHQGNRVQTDIAIKMFMQSKRVLKQGGEMLIVANKHLGYHKKLRSIFHNLKKISENDKFFIYKVHR